MANTKVQYVGDGATVDFSIPFPYINKSHVKVYSDGVLLFTPSDYQFTSPGSIQTTIVPVVDTLIEIKRETEIDTRLVNYQNGAILTEQDMDLDSEQAFYLIQENNENYYDLINDALIALATANGLIVTDPADVLNQLIQNMIDSGAAAILAQRITDIDDNAEAILSNSNAIVNENLGRIADYNTLQSQINALVAATVATVYVQPLPPVPGVGGIPDPIPTGARWYDSDDNNHPYLWDDVGLVWQDLEDPRIGANEAAITALQASLVITDGNVSSNASAIGVLDTTVSNLNGVVVANAADITQLQADVIANDGDILAQGNAATALTARVTVAEGDIGVNASAITALDAAIVANDGDILANSGAITALDTRVGVNEGDITAQSILISGLQSQITSNDGELTTNAGAISALETRATNIEGVNTAQASDLTTLQAQIILRNRTFSQATAPTADNVGDIWFDTDDGQLYRWSGSAWVPIQDNEIAANASAITALDARVVTAEGSIVTQSSDITALENTVNDAGTGVGALNTAVSGLDSRVTTAEGTITSQGSAITSLQSEVDLRSTVFRQAAAPTANNVGDLWFDSDDGDKLYRWSGSVWTDVQDAVIASTASAVSALDTRVTTAEGTIISEASLVDTLQSQMTTAQGDINSAEVTILAHTSAISTAESDIVALEARYGVSLNVNGYISGFSLNNSGTTSDFIILADKFAIVDPSGDPGETEFIPFLVSGGIVSMQNVSISGNLVVNGTITNAQIADLTVRTDELAANAASEIYTDEAGSESATGLTSNVWTTVATVVVPTVASDSGTNVLCTASFDAIGFQNDATGTVSAQVRLRRLSNTVTTQLWFKSDRKPSRSSDHLYTQFANALGTWTYLDTISHPFSNTYTLEFKTSSTKSPGGSSYTYYYRSLLTAQKIKR